MQQHERERATAESDADPEEDGAEVSRLDSLKTEMNRMAAGAALALEVAGLKEPTRPPGRKSLLRSGLLSFFLGPFGWLYAAPLKEAIPAIVIYAAAFGLLQWILPSILLIWILGIVNVVTGLAGALYAWGHNSAGKRVPLVLKEKDGTGGEVGKLLLKKRK
jgi:hypothetical protein